MMIPIILISACSGLLLAFVNDLTKDRIELVKKQALTEALEVVMPGFDNDPLSEKLEKTIGEAELDIYPAKQQNVSLGFAVESTVETGYSGELGVIFGVRDDGTISEVRVLKSNETPGLGSKAGEPEFLDQFEGKSLSTFKLQVEKDGGSVEAVTGATISSRAVALAVSRGLEGVRDLRGAAQ